MKRLKTLLSSITFLVPATLLTTGGTVAYIFPASSYIAQSSVSVVINFYLLGGLMILVMVSSISQALLIIRLVWGAAAVATKDEGESDDFEEADIKAMKVTGTKKVVIAVFLIIVNTALFDYLGKGVVLSSTRTFRVLTLLRSTDAQDRADAIEDAIVLTRDEKIAKALKSVIDEPGESREWAAYAAGVRGDVASADSVLNLLKKGNSREKAAAALALARLKDYRLIRYAADAYAHLGEHKGNLIMAIGMLGKTKVTAEDDLKEAGTFLAEQLKSGTLDKEHTRLTIWALGRFDAPQGLEPIEKLLENAGDSATLCAGLEALGKIGAAQTSPKLIEAIYTLDRTVHCPEVVYSDFTGHEVLLCSGMNIIERLVREIARIGDRRAKPEMEKLSKDKSFSPTVRNLAAEIAFQMKYLPTPDPP